MRNEDEERPMIFFEKNIIVPPAPNADRIQDVAIQRPEDTAVAGRLDSDGQPATRNGRRERVMHEFFDWAKHILIAVLAGLLLVIFVIQRNVVIGSSMEPNLYENDQLFVEKISKLFPEGIASEDIVTVEATGLLGHTGDKNIIKRVIGVPGDKVDIMKDGVYLNDKKIEEPYISKALTVERNPVFSHVTLGENQFYVMGDNREVSLDSRVFGPIDKSRIVGEVLLRFFPFNRIGRP